MEVTIIEKVNDNTTSILIKTEMPVNLLSQLVELSLHFFHVVISSISIEKYV